MPSKPTRNGSKKAKVSEMARKKVKITEGSGNVFADLKFKNADEMLVKADLALRITKAIKARRLTQDAAAKRMGISQPKVSKLVNGELYGFSTENLFSLLNRLGKDVEIVVRSAPRGREHGTVSVHAA
jgi:predicted XRE-type DNA-binding protein